MDLQRAQAVLVPADATELDIALLWTRAPGKLRKLKKLDLRTIAISLDASHQPLEAVEALAERSSDGAITHHRDALDDSGGRGSPSFTIYPSAIDERVADVLFFVVCFEGDDLTKAAALGFSLTDRTTGVTVARSEFPSATSRLQAALIARIHRMDGWAVQSVGAPVPRPPTAAVTRTDQLAAFSAAFTRENDD